MTAVYQISIEPQIDLVRIKMGGFFFKEDVMDFNRSLRKTLQAEGWGFGRHLVLCNVVAMKIQSQDIVHAFSNAMKDPALKSRKLAFVTGSSLARLQTQRLTDRENVAYFSNDNDARTWLLCLNEPVP